MADQAIQVGDMVYVYCPCRFCKDLDYLGYTFKVGAIAMCDWPTQCCNMVSNEVAAFDKEDIELSFDLRELRRIPPLSELEGSSFETYLTVKGLSHDRSQAPVSPVSGQLDAERIQSLSTQVLARVYPTLEVQGTFSSPPRRSFIRKRS